MDDAEFAVTVLSFAVALNAGFRWYERLHYVSRPRAAAAVKMHWLLGAMPLALLVALRFVLHAHAARDVREHGEYLALFTLVGAACLVATVCALAWLGVSAVDDAIERNNVAAGCAVAGALVAGTICYAFANFGEGDTIWTTLGPATLGFVACNLAWALHQALSGAVDAIVIERDVPAGLRFAGMAIGTSLIVGRSLAGDYVSAEATCRDLAHQAWPALPLVALAALAQRALPTGQSTFGVGWLPALNYVGLGVLDVVWLGPWSSAGRP